MINQLTNHAYIIVGQGEGIEKSLLEDFTKLGIEKNGNPDFYIYQKDNLTVEDVRGIGEKAKLKAIGKSDKKIFLIKINSIGIDAQNAFLKVLEEPTSNTHFFIIAPQNIFLPTVLSRVELIDNREIDNREISNILDKNIPERLELVAKLCKDISDEKKEKQDAMEMINQIELEILSKNNVIEKKGELKNCELARKRVMQKGAMVKMVLEDLVMRV